MATNAKRLLTVEEFLELEFSGDECPRIELDNGTIRMMAGGSAAHARVQANIFGTLFERLKGSGCRPYGSDMGVRTHDLSLRYPDVSVFCGREGPENDKLKQFDDPRLVVEVFSPSTRHDDEHVKLREYQAVPSLDAILLVDPEAETIRLLTRGPGRGWKDVELEKGSEVRIKDLKVTLSRDEIFARS
jgi:Uma2 family endonuclease